MPNDVSAEVKAAVAEASKEAGFKPEDMSVTDGFHTAKVDEPAPGPARGEDGKFVSTKTETTEEEGAEKTDDTPPAGEEAGAGAETPTKDEVKEKMESEEDFRPTAEELEVINKSPELTKVYRSMVKGFTAKTSATAAKRKEAEAALNAVRTLREDPDRAIEALAAARGGKYVRPTPAGKEKEEAPPPQKLVVEKLQEKLAAKIGPEAAEVLAPALLEAVTEVTGEELAPIKQAIDEGKRSAQEVATRTAITKFGNSIIKDGGEWNEDIEKDMAQMVGKIVPGEGVTLPEFLDVLYNNVQATRSKTAKTEREVTRLKGAVKRDEPVRPARTPTPAAPAITPGMDAKQATLAAVAAARAELQNR